MNVCAKFYDGVVHHNLTFPDIQGYRIILHILKLLRYGLCKHVSQRKRRILSAAIDNSFQFGVCQNNFAARKRKQKPLFHMLQNAFHTHIANQSILIPL